MTKKAEPVLSVAVPGDRGTIKMRQFTAREYIAMKRGELVAMKRGKMDEVALMELTVAAIIEYLPGRDPWDLPPEDLLGLTGNWLAAKLDDVIPPVTA